MMARHKNTSLKEIGVTSTKVVEITPSTIWRFRPRFREPFLKNIFTNLKKGLNTRLLEREDGRWQAKE